MAQVGVKVVIVPVEGRFQEARLMDMSHDLTLSGWATDSNDPDGFFRPLLSCAAIHSQTNLAHWCDPKFDSVLRKALSSQQLAARIEAYDEAQSILAQELPICRWRRHCVCRPIGTISKVWYLARLVTPPLLGCIARNRMR